MTNFFSRRDRRIDRLVNICYDRASRNGLSLFYIRDVVDALIDKVVFDGDEVDGILIEQVNRQIFSDPTLSGRDELAGTIPGMPVLTLSHGPRGRAEIRVVPDGS